MAAEVGNGQVSIFPVFKGFRRAVSSEMDASAKAGAQGFQRAFSGTAKATGTSAGRGFKQAFQASSGGLGDKALKDMQASVAKSARAVSASRLKEQDAAGKVRVAEKDLAATREKGVSVSARVASAESALEKARGKYKADSVQVQRAEKSLQSAREAAASQSTSSARAEERLASAQRALKTVQDSTKSSTEDLRKAQSNLAQAADQARSATTRSGGGIRAAFSGISSSVQVVGRNIGSFVSKGFEVAKGAATRGMKAISTVAKITGAAVAAVLGGAIAAGFSRMTSIENAQAKLKGLGNSAKNVQAIMSDALAAVKGTAFGLDEAATIAASAVAAGIKPGKELERYLRLTADAATIAGISLSDMGSIINKVSTKGVAQMENINQVSERGIPIMQYLAKEYGVSQAELSKMVSAGKVDAATFRRVLEENLGGAALESGNTTVGAFKNMRAAISRFGVGLLDPVFPLFKDFFNVVGGGFDDLTAKIQPFTADLAPKMQAAFQSALSSVDSFSTNSRAKLTALIQGFRGEWNQALSIDEQGPLFRLGANLSSGLSLAKSAIDSVKGSLNDMFGDVGRRQGLDLGAIFGAVDFSGFAQVASQLSPLLNIFDGLKPVLPVVVEGLASIAATLGGALSASAPVVADLFATIGESLGSNLAALLPSVVGLFESLADVVGQIVPKLEPLVDQLGGVFAEALTALTPVLGQLVDFIAKLLPQLVPLVDPLVQIASAALQLLTPFLSLVSTVLPPLIDLITVMPGGLISLQISLFALKFVLEAVANALTFVADFVTGLMEGVKLFAGYINGTFTPQEFVNKIRSIGGPFGELIKWVTDAGAKVGTFARNAVASIKQFAANVASKVAEAVKFFKDMPGKIKSGFANAGSLLLTVGKQIIQGLVSGIKNAAQTAINAVGEVVNGAISGAKDLLGIKSPSRVFRQIGDYVGQGFVQGIRGTSKQVQAAGSKMAGYIRDAAAAKGVSSSAANRALNVLNTQTRKLSSIADARASIASRMKSAQKSLTAALKVRDDYARSVTEALSGLGSVSGLRSSESMVAKLQAQIGNVNDFSKTITQLKKLGLDNKTLEQLISDFTSSGDGFTARALLDGGGSAVRQVAALQKQLSKSSSALGSSAAKTLYQAGVDSANGLLKGLRSKDSELAKQAAAIAKTLVSTLKKELKIKSPSRVMAQLGVFAGQGFVEGLDSQAAAASAAMTGLTSLPSAASLSAVGAGAAASVAAPVVVEIVGDSGVLEQIVDVRVSRASRARQLKLMNGKPK